MVVVCGVVQPSTAADMFRNHITMMLVDDRSSPAANVGAVEKRSSGGNESPRKHRSITGVSGQRSEMRGRILTANWTIHQYQHLIGVQKIDAPFHDIVIQDARRTATDGDSGRGTPSGWRLTLSINENIWLGKDEEIAQ